MNGIFLNSKPGASLLFAGSSARERGALNHVLFLQRTIDFKLLKELVVELKKQLGTFRSKVIDTRNAIMMV